MDVKEWAKAALVRAVKTAAQSALAVLTGATLMGDVDWALVGSAALFGGVYSLITSVAGVPEVAGGASPLLGGGDGGEAA